MDFEMHEGAAVLGNPITCLHVNRYSIPADQFQENNKSEILEELFQLPVPNYMLNEEKPFKGLETDFPCISRA